jgi:hypothetical protein
MAATIVYVNTDNDGALIRQTVLVYAGREYVM